MLCPLCVCARVQGEERSWPTEEDWRMWAKKYQTDSEVELHEAG